jgi:hypothetical protein
VEKEIEKSGAKRADEYQELYCKKPEPVVISPNRPCDVCPRLVVRVRVSASSLYRGNQIARHKFLLCTVVRVKVTTAKLAESKKEAQQPAHLFTRIYASRASV